MDRRDFMKLGGIIAAAGAPINLYARNQPVNTYDQTKGAVNLIWDGLSLTAEEYSALLMQLAAEGKIKTDYYSNHGIVEELENKFATLLGKEAAVFMPTGTLANHIAVRQLAGNSKRVIVQEQSHLYNDTGDCAQNLSGLNLIPLGQDAIGFTLDEVINTVEKTKKGRVKAKVGVISIESPVRRQNDRILSFESMKTISDYAGSEDIKMHLDGARLFIQSAHTNVNPAKYGELFDTVYTSMWKCFNAASGAVLAGSKQFTEGLFHVRRMFGGGLPFAWPFAAVALYFADSFISEYKQAYNSAEKVFSIITGKDERFKIEKFENGTHVVKMGVRHKNLDNFKRALEKRNILLGNPAQDGFSLRINPSFNRETPEYIAGSFLESLNEV